MARLIVFLLFSNAAFASEATIVGEWQYVAYVYRGNELPPTDPDLTMIYSFGDDGADTLTWTRSDTQEFCSRRATYSRTSGEIDEKVVWVDPKNSKECALDPSMQMGSVSRFPYRVKIDRLELDAFMGNETITYVFGPKWPKSDTMSQAPVKPQE